MLLFHCKAVCLTARVSLREVKVSCPCHLSDESLCPWLGSSRFAGGGHCGAWRRVCLLPVASATTAGVRWRIVIKGPGFNCIASRTPGTPIASTNHLSRGARDRGLGLCGRRSPRAACASDGALRVRCGFRLPRRPPGAGSPPLTDPACSLSELAAEELSAAAAAAAVAAASASSSACYRAATVARCHGWRAVKPAANNATCVKAQAWHVCAECSC